MSTSETVEFDIGPCPCGNGKIVKSVTTQDNPWSGADISNEIQCGKCRSEWSLFGDTLTLRSSREPYDQARQHEQNISRQISVIADVVFERHLKNNHFRSKKAQLEHLTKLELTNYSYRQFLDLLNNGKEPWTACQWSRNVDWLLQNCTSEEKSVLVSLLSEREVATQVCREKEKLITRRSIA